jgi:hypothetical protein
MRTTASLLLLQVLIAPAFGQSRGPAQQSKQRSSSSSAKDRSKAPAKAAETETPLVTMRGTLKTIDKKEIVLETAEEQVLPLRRAKKIKFLKDSKEIPEREFQAGTSVMVEVRREPTGELSAVNVSLETATDR